MRNFGLHAVFAALVFAPVMACVAQDKPAQDKPAPPPPDVLIFTNGDQLTGKLVRVLGGTVSFHSDMAGDITVPVDKVKGMRAGGNFAVLRKDAPITSQPVVPGSFAIEDGKLTLTVKSQPVETLPVKDVGYIIDAVAYQRDIAAKQGILQGWNGVVTGGATIVRSSSNGSTFNLGVALIRVKPVVDFLPKRNRTTVNFTETYGKITEEVPPPAITTKTSIMHADAERDEYMSPRFYYLGEVAFDHNFSQGLDLQQTYGGGLGWTPIQKPNQQLDLKADIHYEKQKFFSQDPTVVLMNQNLIGSTLSEAYRRNLPRKIVFTETANILPAFNNADAYSANFSAILSMPVFKRLSLAVTTTDNFLNNPAPGYQKNSYQFVTGVSYNLR
jgi:hypothetical protein